MQTDQNKFVTSSPKDYEMRFIRVWPLSFPVYDLSSWSQYPNTKVKMRYQYHHGDMMTKELRVIVTSELLLCVIQDLIFSEISECLWYLRYLKWTLSEQPLWTRVKVRGPATFSCSHSLLLDLTHIPNTRHDEAWHWALLEWDFPDFYPTLEVRRSVGLKFNSPVNAASVIVTFSGRIKRHGKYWHLSNFMSIDYNHSFLRLSDILWHLLLHLSQSVRLSRTRGNSSEILKNVWTNEREFIEYFKVCWGWHLG